MKSLRLLLALWAIALAGLTTNVLASGLTPVAGHPRILLTSAVKTTLVAKKNSNDPTWLALKSKADALLNQTIVQFKYNTYSNWYSNSIYFESNGSGWMHAAFTLGLAWQVSGDTNYANKAVALADEIIRADADPDNQGLGKSPITLDRSYTSRHLGPAVAVLYDWCYARLDSSRKAKLRAVMVKWFNHLRNGSASSDVYQKNDPATGAWFGSHMICAAWMGYGISGDDTAAQRMIDWARARFDGTQSATLSASDYPATHRMQGFTGGIKSWFGSRWGVPSTVQGATGAPMKGGMFPQGWWYGNAEFGRMVDYMMVVKSATNEDLVGNYQSYLADIFAAHRHATLPGNLLIDPNGEWRGSQGAVVERGLPARLATALAGVANIGAAAAHFAWSEIPQPANSVSGVSVAALQPWEDFLYRNTSATGSTVALPLCYTGFAPNYPAAAAGNGAIPYFTMRSSWGGNAVWASVNMGAQVYDEFMHYQAGHIEVAKGNHRLLISPTTWKGDSSGLGVTSLGPVISDHSGAKNTLYFGDFGDYQSTSSTRVGGQGPHGKDKVVAQEMNPSYSYISADLSTAYNNMDWPRSVGDTTNRKLDYFYRNFVYLRPANLFVVYDRVKAFASSNANGAYKKRLRWHFPTQPLVSGSSIRVDNSDARLWLQTLLPANPTITTSSLVSNPDNTWGAWLNYLFASKSYRAEVSNAANPLQQPFLTVMQAGTTSLSEPTSALFYTTDSLMIGTTIEAANGNEYVVLFNNRTGQVPQAITWTSYYLPSSINATHTVCGLEPNTAYTLDLQGSLLVIAKDPAGGHVSTPAGVLQFTPPGGTPQVDGNDDGDDEGNGGNNGGGDNGGGDNGGGNNGGGGDNGGGGNNGGGNNGGGNNGGAIIAGHPRLLLTPAIKTTLLAKVQANDPTWTALKTRADILLTYPITQYKTATAYNWFANTIFYGYQGEGWYSDVIPLAFAWQMTGDTNYCNKLLAIADEFIRAEYDPANQPPTGRSPMTLGNAFPSRYVGPAAAIIFDWCYDRLGPARKNQMVNLFNRWFDSLRVPGGSAYENNGPSNGNHYGGHMAAAGWMGYASHGDNPRAQHLIDWAMVRMDGTLTPNLAATDIPASNRKQDFEGDVTNYVGSIWGIPSSTPGIHGAPFRGGHNFQGWAYGNGEFSQMIDLLQAMKTAGGPDFFQQYPGWFSGMYRSMRHALMPSRFMIDPIGDWGGNNAVAIQPGLPHRLSFVLQSTPDGPAAQHFANVEMAQNHAWNFYAQDVRVIELRQWEAFYYQDFTRPATPAVMPTWYNNINAVRPNGSSPNGAIPYYIMRSGWDTGAVWASLQMGSAKWGDHQHLHAGHLHIVRGRDQLLISPSNWKGGPTGLGIVGNGIGYTDYSGVKNTLFFDDYGDYQRKSSGNIGGQDVYGFDRPVANEFTEEYGYARSDLTSAYNYAGWNPATQSSTQMSDTTQRKLEKFYRNFLYLKGPGIFVTYDQIKAKNSTNQLGQYRKHLRWHFPDQPTISGNSIRADKGASRIWMHTVLPATVGFTKYSLQSNNPDNTYNDASLNYLFVSNTWRVEARDTLNPLEMPFLTVMQAGPANLAEMTTSAFATTDSLMIGARITTDAGQEYLVLFNNRTGVVQQAITSTNYPLLGAASATHLLCGMVPAGKYQIAVSNGVVTVAQNAAGTFTASAGGVLTFQPSAVSGAAKAVPGELSEFSKAQLSLSVFPNPSNGVATVNFRLPESGKVEVRVLNVLGGVVAQLVNRSLPAGVHAVEWHGEAEPTGTYLVEISAGSRRAVQRLVLTN